MGSFDDSGSRKAAAAWALGRIGYAAGVIAAPTRFAGPWLGDSLSSGGGRVGAKTMVTRDGLMAAGVLASAYTGRPVRPWIAACAASDLGDIAFTLAERDELPDGSARMTAAVAGVAMLSGIALLFAVER